MKEITRIIEIIKSSPKESIANYDLLSIYIEKYDSTMTSDEFKEYLSFLKDKDLIDTKYSTFGNNQINLTDKGISYAIHKKVEKHNLISKYKSEIIVGLIVFIITTILNILFNLFF